MLGKWGRGRVRGRVRVTVRITVSVGASVRGRGRVGDRSRGRSSAAWAGSRARSWCSVGSAIRSNKHPWVQLWVSLGLGWLRGRVSVGGEMLVLGDRDRGRGRSNAAWAGSRARS